MIRLGATPVTARIAGNRTRTIVGAGLVVAPPDDTTAPVLTSPSATATGTTTLSATVTVNEANGTLFAYPSDSATPPSAATVKTSTFTQAITTTGAKTIAITGLPPGTTRYIHFLHRDAAGNDSAIVSSGAVTTDAEVLTGAAIRYLGIEESPTATHIDLLRNSVSAEAEMEVARSIAALGVGTEINELVYGHAFNTAYWCALRARNGATLGTTYAPFQINTRPELAVNDLTATADAFGKIELAWSYAVNPISGGFKIERLVGAEWVEIANVAAAAREYLAGGMTAETSYSHRVKAYNSNPDDVSGNPVADSDGPASNVATATTQTSSILYQYDFEPGEDHTGWLLTASGGAFVQVADSTRLLHSGTALGLRGGGSGMFVDAVPPAHAAMDEVHYAFVQRHEATTGFVFNLPGICWFKSHSWNGAIQIDPSPEHWTGSLAATGTGQVGTDVVRYFWVSVRRKIDAVDGYASILISDSPTKPTPDANNSASIVHTVTAAITRPEFYKHEGSELYLDHFIASSEPIGDLI